MQDKVAGLRRFGAAALDLAWVAAGRFDGYWERSLSPWDIAAGVSLVREAGGFVTDLDGNERTIGAGRHHRRQRDHAPAGAGLAARRPDGRHTAIACDPNARPALCYRRFCAIIAGDS